MALAKKTNHAVVFYDDSQGLIRAFISINGNGRSTIVREFLATPATIGDDVQKIKNNLHIFYGIPFHDIHVKPANLQMKGPARDISGVLTGSGH